MNTLDSYLAHKKILIFGLGRQGGGLGDANYLARHNYSVRVTDQLTLAELGIPQSSLDPKIELSLGGHDPRDLDWADLIIQNPGVPDEHPLLTQARAKNIPIASSISLFVKYAHIPTIGITGTRGKTTTTQLIATILESQYPGKVIVGGNVPGTSGLSLFDIAQDKSFAVLELSSFQLHSFHTLRVSPTYAVITNLYPDHLNRYPDMAAYQKDKEAICAYPHPPGFTIYNQENEGSLNIAKVSPVPTYPFRAADSLDYPTSLPGAHNQSNLAAAIALTTRLGVTPKQIAQSIASFQGVPYRQETIRVHRGITYINDTTATTPTAARIALQAQTQPTILICGGESKKLPYQELVDEITNNDHVKKVILLGSHHLEEFTALLKSKAPLKLAGQVDSMAQALELAQSHASPGDVVLLSPGFASFDLFKNEFDRGDQFNKLVRALT